MKVSKIIVEHDYITFTVVHTVFKKKTKNAKVIDENGIESIIPVEYEVKDKTLYLKHTCKMDSISSIDQHVNDKNQIVKNKCVIFDRMSGRDYLVNNSLEEVKQVLLNRYKKIGY